MGVQTKAVASLPKATEQRVDRKCFSGFLLSIVIAGVLCGAEPAEANIVSGLSKIVAGAFQLPLSVLVGTFSGPPIVGTLMGAVNGTIRTVSLVAGGTLELATDGVALAKRAAPYVLPFLL